MVDPALSRLASEFGRIGGRAGAGRPRPAKTPAAAARRTANLPKTGQPRKPRCAACQDQPRRCAACVAASRAT